MIVQCHGVIYAAVIPDGYKEVSFYSLHIIKMGKGYCIVFFLFFFFLTNIVLVLPVEPHLEVMVLVDQIEEPLQQVITLLLGQPDDMFGEAADWEDALPPRHRVCPYHGVNRFQVGADVLWRTASCRVELEVEPLGGFPEILPIEGSRQGLEELLVGLRDAVV